MTATNANATLLPGEIFLLFCSAFEKLFLKQLKNLGEDEAQHVEVAISAIERKRRAAQVSFCFFEKIIIMKTKEMNQVIF